MLKKYSLTIIVIILGLTTLYVVSADANVPTLNTVALSEQTLEDALADIDKVKNGNRDEVSISFPPLIPPLEEYLPADTWDSNIMPSYVALSNKEASEILATHLVELDISNKNSIGIESVIGTVTSISKLQFPETKQPDALSTNSYLTIKYLSGLKYTGEQGSLYVSVVEMTGLAPEQPLFLGIDSMKAGNRTVWVAEEMGMHQLNQVSFACGNKVVGVIGAQTTEQLVSISTHLKVSEKLGCD